MTFRDKQVEFYRRHGYLVVADVFTSDEVADLRLATEDLVAKSASVVAHTELYDLEDSHTKEKPRVRRLKAPYKHHAAFAQAVRNANVVAILEKLWGAAQCAGVRFDQAKLNLKDAGFGAPVEWHQDWAFYPHTNDDLAAVGIMLDDFSVENGAMQVIPGSHLGPIFDHHAEGFFCGAIDLANADIDFAAAVPLEGKAGSISVHHVRLIHGSPLNRSSKPRRYLLQQYRAADAWPLLGVDDYEKFRSSLLSGRESIAPRVTDVPVRLPLPAAPKQGSIYENQKGMAERYFERLEDAAQRAAS